MYYFVMPIHPSHARAVVVHANHAQFAPSQIVKYNGVASRMVLWCQAGTGTVTVNGQKFLMDAGLLLVLPWKHTVRYDADADNPFRLGGVHILPHHAKSRPVKFAVAHEEGHPLAAARWRRDTRLADIPELKALRMSMHEPLPHLLEYIVSVFLHRQPQCAWAREMAGLVLHEVADAVRRPALTSCPPELERMRQYIESHLDQPVSLRDLADFASLSHATVGRMFRQHLDTTPVTYILRHKMERARPLLRNRRYSVTEVASAVGFSDPYYFSKCFKRHTGHSPQQYRSGAHWL